MKNAAFVILSVALGVWIVSCEKQDVKPEESLSLEVRRDSVTDFASFLEGISRLVSDQPVTLRIPGRQGDRKLMFWRSGGPGCPALVRVLPDSVSLGSGAGQSSMTLEQLRSSMKLYGEAAKSANSHAIILLVSDQHVSGEFGLSILELLADSGIDFIALVEPDGHEKKPLSDSENPKPKPRSPWESGSRIVR